MAACWGGPGGWGWHVAWQAGVELSVQHVSWGGGGGCAPGWARGKSCGLPWRTLLVPSHCCSPEQLAKGMRRATAPAAARGPAPSGLARPLAAAAAGTLNALTRRASAAAAAKGDPPLGDPPTCTKLPVSEAPLLLLPLPLMPVAVPRIAATSPEADSCRCSALCCCRKAATAAAALLSNWAGLRKGLVLGSHTSCREGARRPQKKAFSSAQLTARMRAHGRACHRLHQVRVCGLAMCSPDLAARPAPPAPSWRTRACRGRRAGPRSQPRGAAGAGRRRPAQPPAAQRSAVQEGLARYAAVAAVRTWSPQWLIIAAPLAAASKLVGPWTDEGSIAESAALPPLGPERLATPPALLRGPPPGSCALLCVPAVHPAGGWRQGTTRSAPGCPGPWRCPPAFVGARDHARLCGGAQALLHHTVSMIWQPFTGLTARALRWTARIVAVAQLQGRIACIRVILRMINACNGTRGQAAVVLCLRTRESRPAGHHCEAAG